MEALFIFIAKSSGLITLFYLAYYFLLRKETFFNSNRWYLLAGLITSVVLPFLVYTKTILVAPTPISNSSFLPTDISQNIIREEIFEINWNYVVLMIYALGLVSFLIKFGLDYYSLNSVLKGKKIKQQADFKFVDIDQNIAPFSYFDYIVYNSKMFSAEELENIIEHEKVHSEQNHTADMLISRVFCILFWFNPIIWWYKKAIVQNLEFIADKEAAKIISDKKAYQYTLLKITTHESCLSITNHFYQSLIKKRIIMLNKNQSKKRNAWKYYVVIPALVAFVALFQVKTIAQEKGPNSGANINPEKVEAVEVFTISKNTSDADIDQRIKTLKEKFDITATVSELERNSNQEITAIQLELKDKKGVTKAKKSVVSTGIEKIGIIVISEKSGEIIFNFADDKTVPTGAKTEAKDVIIKIKNNQNSNTNRNDQSNSSSNTNVSTNVSTNVNSNTNTTTSVNTNSINVTTHDNVVTITNHVSDPKPLIVINGTITPNVTVNDIDVKVVKNMNVLRGLNAKAKYGDAGNNDVIEITTK